MSKLGIYSSAVESFMLSPVKEGKFKNENKPPYFNWNLKNDLLWCITFYNFFFFFLVHMMAHQLSYQVVYLSLEKCSSCGM